MTVVKTPCETRMFCCTPCLLSRWRKGGRYPSSRPTSIRPLEGPASHVSIPPTDAAMSISPRIGVSQPTWKFAKNASNACMTPAVRLSWSAGITHEIARAGRMKITSTSPIARNIARGNSRAGSRRLVTCTAFISMPAYERKLLMISTSDAMPVHCGSRWLESMGAADSWPCPRNTTPSTTRIAAGTRVPMIRPALDRPATVLVPCDEMYTPAQYTTTMTIAT